jgi:hypothetical protein
MRAAPIASSFGQYLRSVIVSSICSHSRVFNFLRNANDFAVFVSWVRSLDFNEAKFFKTREKLLVRSISGLTKSDVYEFGVANGYLSSFIGSRCDSSVGRWVGFDSFVGLGRAWRGELIGAYSTHGEIPIPYNEKYSFIKGFIEETLPSFDLNRLDDSTALLVFDLDLFEPTLLCYSKFKSFLQPGDLLYFDQAFDEEERSIIEKYVFLDFDTEVVAYTYFSILLKIK